MTQKRSLKISREPPNFIRAAKIEPFPLDKPIGIQLAVTGSKSVINYGANATINMKGEN